MKAKPPKEKGGSNENARHLKSNQSSLTHKDGPVSAYGTHQLSAWRVAVGLFWFQTIRSDFARKLAKRRDARRVEVSGLNHYRQTFEIRGTRRKVKRIIKRYLASAPDQFSAATVALDLSKTVPRVKIAGDSVTRRCVACGTRVTNRNLGGYSGRSALSGSLWCDRCADCAQQRRGKTP
jgi:hypothetical protein